MRRTILISALVVAAAAACHRGTPARPEAGPGPARTAAPEPPAPRPPRGKQITIVYSSNLLGEYEPCG